MDGYLMKSVRDEDVLAKGVCGDVLYNNKQRTLLILAYLDYKDIAAFEQVCVSTRAFVFEHHVWTALFKRDYPYALPSDDHWKGYYEHMVKTTRVIDKHWNIQRELSVEKVTLCPRGWTLTFTASLSSYWENWDFYNPSGLKPKGWKLFRQQGTNIFYYYPRTYYTIGTLIKPSHGENHPKNVVCINMDIKQTNVIPWFNDVMIYDEIYYRYNNGIKYMLSIDGLECFIFSGYALHTIKPA